MKDWKVGKYVVIDNKRIIFTKAKILWINLKE